MKIERLFDFWWKDTFIIFSGDGDFANIYEFLLKNGKQIFVFHGGVREKVVLKNGKIKRKTKDNLCYEVKKLYSKYPGKIITKNLSECVKIFK